MPKRIIAAIVQLFALLVVTPADAQNSFGNIDPDVDRLPGRDVYLSGFTCPSKHLSRVTFQHLTSVPLALPFAPTPWLTTAPIVEFAAGATDPVIDVDLDLTQLGPGTHYGVVKLECVACESRACQGQVLTTLVDVNIPVPAVFGAAAADAQFGGLVGGQPVPIEILLPNVLNDIKKSTFGALPNAIRIFNTLDNHYFENGLSDVSIVRTVDNTNESSGRISTRIIPVDDNSPAPGEGAYTVNQIGGEEIYLGVDMSLQGITAARRDPTAYYVFTIGGDIGVISKSDLVHNLIHEGLHATLAGNYNCARPRGGTRGGCIEEEQEGFRVGNAAAAALGLPVFSNTPTSRGYNAGSNPAYPVLFPSLLVAPGTAAPGTAAPGTNAAGSTAAGTNAAGTATPGNTTSTPAASAGPPATPGDSGQAETNDDIPANPDDSQSGASLQYTDENDASGYCSTTGSELSCDGGANFVLTCEPEAASPAACSLRNTDLADPCSFTASGWVCTDLPTSVMDCGELGCSVSDSDVSGACEAMDMEELDFAYRCSQIPVFEMTCEDAGSCSFTATTMPDSTDCPAGDCDDEIIDFIELKLPDRYIASVAAPQVFASTQPVNCNDAGRNLGVPLQLLDGDFDDTPFFFENAINSSDNGLTMQALLSDLDIGSAWFGDQKWVNDTWTPGPLSLSGIGFRDMPEARQFEVMLTPRNRDFGRDRWPGNNRSDEGYADDPVKALISTTPRTPGTFGLGGSGFQISGKSYNSINVETSADELPADLGPFVDQQVSMEFTQYTTLLYEDRYAGVVTRALRRGGFDGYEVNPCRVVLLPTDPGFLRTGRNGGNSWGAREDDQWAIKRVGLTNDARSAWNSVASDAESIVVAVIDTGLDWHHIDISPENIWQNASEYPDNGVDDDNNGYVDDIIGWNVAGRNNKPWDFDGHGTVVTGIIAADHNDTGIAGVNPNVQIMVLKAVNDFGTTRASHIAEAIVYAVNNGARIINISVGGASRSAMEQAALNYASDRGVLILAAAGNDGKELDDFGPGGATNVITVGATHFDDRAAGFSNYGDAIDIVAPGVDVLSLRARFTDANYRPALAQDGEEYNLGDNYVGDDRRYLRVSGTSFSTPIVTGIASLILGNHPNWTAAEISNSLLNTATDLETAGRDKYTGYGMVDARAALEVDAEFFIEADISALTAIPAESPSFIEVKGTVNANSFKRAWMQIGPGENPAEWRFVGPKRKFPIADGTLGVIPLAQFSGSELWQVVINVEHRNGVVRRATYPIRIR